MSDNQIKIDELIKSLKQSKQYDAILVADLAAALCENGGVKKDFLCQLLAHDQSSIRVAAVMASEGRKEGEVHTALIRLANDPEPRVRRALAKTIALLPESRFSKTFDKLFEDEDIDVRVETLKSSHGRNELIAWQRQLIGDDPSPIVRTAAAEALNSLKLVMPTYVDDFLHAFAQDKDAGVRQHCADLLDRRLTLFPDCEQCLTDNFEVIGKAIENFKTFPEDSYPSLAIWLKKHSVKKADPDELSRYGTDLTELAEKGKLPRAYGAENARDMIMKMLAREGAKAVVLLGATGVGKSAIVNELVYELMKPEHGEWRVLRVSPTEFMTGTRYLGEWESRVNNLIQEVKKPCHVILYIPNLGELAGMGQWSKSQANVGTALAPYIEDGSIVVIGESTPSEYAVGVGALPQLNRLFDKILVEPANENLTREILAAVRDDSDCKIPDAVLANIVDLSDQYLNQSARPGNAVSLLRDVIASQAGKGQPVTNRAVLDAVSKSTGVPADFLDDSVPLDLHELRSFFEKRIMGQPEAVEAVMDLLTLIKAGLTDQSKPFGVFLFVGPTGVGKTELARALAEYVFGDVTRLQRFDMSEFASYEGFERLIGTGSQLGILTESVRQKPFSVILLDEIEKGHTNVFDLCLQLFDAGRLTDAQGRTVDFRRTIVILTSNVGATAGSEMVLGFGANAQKRESDELSKERTFRELSRVFRPEFLNRIDRIVNFRPLSLQVAETIARREIDVVLKRSGITRRHLSVDIDPSVIAALLKEGYSQSFGARPLKRAVERMLLLPLAKAIATGRISGKTVLRLNATTGNKIDVKIISTPADEPKAKIAPAAVRSNESLVALSQELVDGIAALEDHIVPLSERKSELLHQIHQPDFYRDHNAKTATFDEIHKLDQFLATYEGLCKVVSGVHDRLARPVSRSDEPALLERINQLGAELEHLSFIATNANLRDMSDALVAVRLIDRTDESIGGVDTMVKMYIAFAKRRRLTVEVMSEYMTESEESVYIHTVGLGAYALLKNEIGVHQFDNRQKSRNGKDRHRQDREVVRVDVMSLESEPDKAFLSKVKSTIQRAKVKNGTYLKKLEYDISLFHEPSVRSFRGLFPGERDGALANAQTILHAMVRDQDTTAIDYIVRYYDFGTGAKIKDARSGITTGRIDQVLKGNLDLFIRSVGD